MSVQSFIFFRVFFFGSKTSEKADLLHPDNQHYLPESLRPAPKPSEAPDDGGNGFRIDFGDDSYIGDFPAGFGEKHKDVA